jgi:hypothetical protein
VPKFYQQCFVNGVRLSDRKTIEVLESDIHRLLPAGSYGVEIDWVADSENSIHANVSYLKEKVSSGL